MFKKLVLTLFILVSLFTLTACKSKEDNVIGLWIAEFDYGGAKGNTFRYELTINKDNTYTEVSYKLGKAYETRGGEWYFEGSELVSPYANTDPLTLSIAPVNYMRFKIDGSKLVCTSTEFDDGSHPVFHR